MAYPSSPTGAAGAPGARPLPKNVDTAVLLVKILAILSIIYAPLSLIGQRNATVEVETGASEDAAQAFQNTGTVIGAIVSLGIGIGLLFLAKALLRGSQPARVTTWVIGGVLILCGLAGLCGSAFSPDISGVPGWYTAWSWLTTFATLGFSIAIIVLLATPAANVFFQPAPLMPPPAAPPGRYGGSPGLPGSGERGAEGPGSPGESDEPPGR